MTVTHAVIFVTICAAGFFGHLADPDHPVLTPLIAMVSAALACTILLAVANG